ncbi:MAG: class I lanthipeptide [Acidobacteriota bacterium]|nr:class I lanthipeptide [Acidobacteriota bacterium]
MKKLAVKKLTISKETLRRLEEDRLRELQGGQRAWTGDSVNVCCA